MVSNQLGLLMNFIPLLIVISVLAAGAASQSVSGSIKVKECRGCEDIVVWPTVEYPAYVGCGPHKFEGDVGIEAFVDNNGSVVAAKAVFGHPFFRPMLEKEALRAKFNVANSEVGRKATFIFTVSPPRRESEPPVGVINGRAWILPKPEYNEDLMNLCASGKVELEVHVSKSGNVLRAKARSGDELLYEPSLKAVLTARFEPTHGQPIPYRGLVVYNFPSKRECIDVKGKVNGKWTERPSFSVHPHARVKRPTKIAIRLSIEPFSGKVLAAKATSGHPLIRRKLEIDAMRIKFRPLLINSEPFIVKGVMVVRILPNGRVTF